MYQINPLVFLHTVEHVKYTKPSCCGAPQSSQTAAEHMFRHALICLIIPLADMIDRDKLVIMALIHDIADFRSWDGVQQKKRLNMDYLACNLSTDTASDLQDCWAEYWDKKTPEAQLAHEACAFEHMVAMDEDGIGGDSMQHLISSPELLKWIEFWDASKTEMINLQNIASFGSSYWDNPEENMRLLGNFISKDETATSSLLFIRMLKDMSAIKRRGWMERGMDPSVAESNASHSWRVALICLLFSPKNEAFRSTKLSLIHDLGEIVIGDVIPSDRRAKLDKQRHERFGQKFLVHVSKTNTMEPYLAEFEAPKSTRSVAAQIAHEADSLECRVEAVEYILRYPQFENLFDFLESTLKAVYFQDLTSLLIKEETSLRERQSQFTIIFVSGGPGVGKDTQCTKLAEELNFCHIPTGDLLRKEINRGSRYSEFIQKSINIGFAVPAELMTSLLIAAAKGLKLLVNGFPRSSDQLSTFEQRVSRTYSTLVLHCPPDVLRARLMNRATSSLRSDDNESIIDTRLKAYLNEHDLQIRLEESGPFERIDSSGPKEEVYALAKDAIGRLLEKLSVKTIKSQSLGPVA